MESKLAFILTNFSNKPDGISIYSENLLSELLLLNKFQIHVFIKKQNFQLIKNRLSTIVNLDRIKFIKIGFTYKIYIFIFLTIYLNFKKYNLVVMPSLIPCISIKNKSIRIIHDFTFLKKGNSLKNLQKLYRHILQYFSYFDDYIGYISESTLRDINNLGKNFLKKKNKIYVPPGLPFTLKINDLKFKKINNNQIRFLFIGSLNYHKGLDRVINFINYFNNNYNKKKIYLYLAGKEKDETKKILKRLKINDNISTKFFNYVPDNLLIELYKKSDFLLYFSRNEGFGIPILEAINFSCIPVLSKISSSIELIKNNNYPLFLNKNNYESLSKELVKIVDEIKNKNKIQETLNIIHKRNYENFKYSALKINEIF